MGFMPGRVADPRLIAGGVHVPWLSPRAEPQRRVTLVEGSPCGNTLLTYKVLTLQDGHDGLDGTPTMPSKQATASLTTAIPFESYSPPVLVLKLATLPLRRCSCMCRLTPNSPRSRRSRG